MGTVSRRIGRSAVAPALAAWMAAGAVHAAPRPPLAPPGIWCATGARALRPAHERRLVDALRRVTGRQALAFGTDGALLWDDHAVSGSPTARLVLDAVRGSGMSFLLEDHSGSHAVQFGQLDAGTVVTDAQAPGPPRTLWRLRLDFADLSRFEAAPAVRAAFDPAFAFLHELLHGLGFRDSDEPEEVGAVERILNQVRSELGLPRRDRYFGAGLWVAETLMSVRLRFRSEVVTAEGPRARYEYLVFLVDTRYLDAPANGVHATIQAEPWPWGADGIALTPAHSR